MEFVKFDEKLKKFVNEDDIYYVNKKEFVQCGIFNFCGCGDSTRNLRYIKEQLEKINKGSVYEINEDNAVFYFFLYWADKEELIEHGCSVGGSWLTDKGKEVLRLINESLERE